MIGFFDSWPAKRKFPVDMAGFAVNVDLILKHPNATMPYKAGYEEDRFISSLGVKLSDIEPKANNCSEVSENIFKVSTQQQCDVLDGHPSKHKSHRTFHNFSKPFQGTSLHFFFCAKYLPLILF